MSRRRSNRSIVVRAARKGDLRDTLDIYNDSILNSTATFDLEAKTLGDWKKWFSGHGRGHPVLVAEVRDKVVGYACLSIFRTKPAYSMSAESSVYVHRDFRGMGVGSALMESIVEKAIELGYHSIVSGIVPPNERSVNLHKRLGFELVGAFPEVGFKFGRWQDVEFFELILPGRFGFAKGTLKRHQGFKGRLVQSDL
jgi:L-amino acid N-acyltransferase